MVATPPGVSLTLDTTSLAADLVGPVRAAFPFGPGTSLFDAFGYTRSLDAGTLTDPGDSFGSPIDFVAGLGTTPLDFIYPLNSIGQVVLVDSAAARSTPRSTCRSTRRSRSPRAA